MQSSLFQRRNWINALLGWIGMLATKLGGKKGEALEDSKEEMTSGRKKTLKGQEKYHTLSKEINREVTELRENRTVKELGKKRTTEDKKRKIEVDQSKEDRKDTPDNSHKEI